MVRGKPLECPPIVLVTASDSQFKTMESTWEALGHILARIIVKVIEANPTSLHK